MPPVCRRAAQVIRTVMDLSGASAMRASLSDALICLTIFSCQEPERAFQRGTGPNRRAHTRWRPPMPFKAKGANPSEAIVTPRARSEFIQH